jgi:hypothetical protein
MKIGIVGAGAITNTSYLPALANLSSSQREKMKVTVTDINPQALESVRQTYGVNTTNSFSALCGTQLDYLILATPPEGHYQQVKEGLETTEGTRVVCEKPATTSKSELPAFHQLNQNPHYQGRLLLGDHWLPRGDTLQKYLDPFGPVTHMSGFFNEPSTTSAEGTPLPLDFKTRLPDQRPWIHEHPHGVLLDTVIHLFNLMARLLPMESPFSIHVDACEMKDRFKTLIQSGNHQAAEGYASIKGHFNTHPQIPFTLEANKYSDHSKKGIILNGSSGQQLTLFGSPHGDYLHHKQGRKIDTIHVKAPLYERFIDLFLPPRSIFENPALVKTINQRHLIILQTLFDLHRQIRGVKP